MDTDEQAATTGGYAFGGSPYVNEGVSGGNMMYEWYNPGGAAFALLDGAFLVVLLVTIYCLYANVTPSSLVQGIGVAVAVIYVASEVLVALKGKEYVNMMMGRVLPAALVA